MHRRLAEWCLISFDLEPNGGQGKSSADSCIPNPRKDDDFIDTTTMKQIGMIIIIIGAYAQFKISSDETFWNIVKFYFWKDVKHLVNTVYLFINLKKYFQWINIANFIFFKSKRQ